MESTKKEPTVGHIEIIPGTERTISKETRLSKIQLYALNSAIEKVNLREQEYKRAEREREDIVAAILEELGFDKSSFLKLKNTDGDVTIFGELPSNDKE